MIFNAGLLVIGFALIGKEFGGKTVYTSLLLPVVIGVFEKMFHCGTVIPNVYLSAFLGAAIIALASGIMFYVKSSSGGTDIIALIVKKYSNINIGKALLITDFLIVIVGGLLSGYIILASSFVGLLIKTIGIDFILIFNNNLELS